MANGNNGDGKIKVILQVGINEKNQVTVSGPIQNKRMCVDLLAQAISIVNGLPDKPQSKIIKPRDHLGCRHNKEECL